jgi:hypothetical protein
LLYCSPQKHHLNKSSIHFQSLLTRVILGPELSCDKITTATQIRASAILLLRSEGKGRVPALKNKRPVPTSKETYYISTKNTTQLMVCRKIVYIYNQNYTKLINHIQDMNKPHKQNVESSLLLLKTMHNNFALKH